MELTHLLEYLERHITWRNVAFAMAMLISGCIGYYYSDAKREKSEAELIYKHTREIKAYSDSAHFEQAKTVKMEVEYKVLLWRKEKTIDSLNLLIRRYENENK